MLKEQNIIFWLHFAELWNWLNQNGSWGDELQSASWPTYIKRHVNANSDHDVWTDLMEPVHCSRYLVDGGWVIARKSWDEECSWRWRFRGQCSALKSVIGCGFVSRDYYEIAFYFDWELIWRMVCRRSLHAVWRLTVDGCRRSIRGVEMKQITLLLVLISNECPVVQISRLYIYCCVAMELQRCTCTEFTSYALFCLVSILWCPTH